MSDQFVPSKRHLREVLLFCFHLKKSAAESRRMIFDAYGEHAPSSSACEFWFRRFKNGDFSTDDKDRPGQPRKFEDEELDELDSSQTSQELADSLNVSQATISKRLKAKRARTGQ